MATTGAPVPARESRWDGAVQNPLRKQADREEALKSDIRFGFILVGDDQHPFSDGTSEADYSYLCFEEIATLMRHSELGRNADQTGAVHEISGLMGSLSSTLRLFGMSHSECADPLLSPI